MDSTHIRWLEECLEKIQLKGPKGRRWKKDKESMTEKRNQSKAPVVPNRRGL
jgi:hypothetical protein